MESEFSEIEASDFTFPSALGATMIHAKQWVPPAGVAVKGIFQITHGMAEYIERYDHFARFLAHEGFVVCGQDNIGHGGSVESPDEWGCMPAQTGKKTLIENVHTLRTIMIENRGDRLPYFMYGHSMGSFIVRSYLTQYGQGLAGAVLSGTAYQPAAVAKAGLLMAKALVKIKGEAYRSSVLYNMAEGAYSKAIKNARTRCDWLSTDPLLVDAYVNDPACGFRFSAGAYVVLMGLLADLAKTKRLKRIPSTLPIFLIAGFDDPVGDRGRGVTQVFKEYKDAGLKKVDMRLYLGMRHEVHNEVDKEKVYNDVLKWLEGQGA